MSAHHYKNAVNSPLEPYLSPDRFRTILYSQRDIPCGLSEIRVELELNPEFVKTLSFPVSSSGRIYGLVRKNQALATLDGIKSGKGTIKLISLHDWDDRFVMIFENEDGAEHPVFYIEPDEVRSLLEHCLRVPEQRGMSVSE